MRLGEKTMLEQQLRELSSTATGIANRLRDVAEGPPFRWSVAWGNAPQAIISVDDRDVHRRTVEELVDSAIWALFESCRDGTDPSDPKAFARVMDRVIAEAKKRCHQSEPSGSAGDR